MPHFNDTNQINNHFHQARPVDKPGEGMAGLLIFQGVAAQGRDIPFNIHPKDKYEINNKRGAHSKE